MFKENWKKVIYNMKGEKRILFPAEFPNWL